jgi:hypothetical protein
LNLGATYSINEAVVWGNRTSPLRFRLTLTSSSCFLILKGSQLSHVMIDATTRTGVQFESNTIMQHSTMNIGYTLYINGEGNFWNSVN